jgi:hypothetical protein
LNLFDDEPRRFGDDFGAVGWGGTLYELLPGNRRRTTGRSERRNAAS